MSPHDKKKIHFAADDPQMPTVKQSEAKIAKAAPGLKARVEQTDWPAEKKQTFLDMLLGKEKGK